MNSREGEEAARRLLAPVVVDRRVALAQGGGCGTMGQVSGVRSDGRYQLPGSATPSGGRARPPWGAHRQFGNRRVSRCSGSVDGGTGCALVAPKATREASSPQGRMPRLTPPEAVAHRERSASERLTVAVSAKDAQVGSEALDCRGGPPAAPLQAFIPASSGRALALPDDARAPSWSTSGSWRRPFRVPAAQRRCGGRSVHSVAVREALNAVLQDTPSTGSWPSDPARGRIFRSYAERRP